MTNEALRTMLPIAGWPERAREVEITGGTDPILPTPFRIGETAAARSRRSGWPSPTSGSCAPGGARRSR